MSTVDLTDPASLLKQELTESKDNVTVTETAKYNRNHNESNEDSPIFDNDKLFDESLDNETYTDSVKNEVLDIKLENSELVDPDEVAEIPAVDKRSSTATKEEIGEEAKDFDPENDQTEKV